MKASGVQRKIDTMVRRIVKRFGPERIVLFGSHAYRRYIRKRLKLRNFNR